MLAATLRSLLSRKLRLVLSGLAVVLGVMAVSGALVVTETVSRSFDSLFQTVNQSVDVRVTGHQQVDAQNPGDVTGMSVPAGLVDRIAEVPGVRSAVGDVTAPGVRVVGRDGKVIPTPGPPTFGISWESRGGLGDMLELRDGRGPASPDEIAISAGLAKTGGFGLGDRAELLTLRPNRAFTVVGVFGYSGGRATLGGETRAAFTTPVAQRLLLGESSAYSSIDVTAADGVSQPALRDTIQAALGERYVVRTGEQVAADQAATTSAFLAVVRQSLLGFAGVTLLVGILLILNTFSILIAQRTRELALFRALGAGRAQIIGSVMVEAVVVGLVAATAGLGAGIGLAALLKAVMQAQSGATLPGAALVVPSSAVIASYLVGVVATVVAALLPALRAAGVPPVAAMRESATVDRPLRMLTLSGSLATLAGVGAVVGSLVVGVGDGTPWILFGGVLAAFLGAALLTPAISRPAVHVLGAPFSRSVPGRLGGHNSARSPRRTAITAAALMVGIALVTGVSVLASSLRSSLEDATTGLRASLVISGPADFGGPDLPATFDPAITKSAARIPGVASVAEVYSGRVQLGSGAEAAAGGDLAAVQEAFRLRPVAGELRTLGAGEIAVDDDIARTRDLAVGDTVRLATQRGAPRDVRVVAVYERTQLLPGVLLPVGEARDGFRAQQPAQGYLTLTADANVDRVRAQVGRLLAASPDVSVRDQSDYAAQQTEQVDAFLVMLYVLLGLAIVVATLGIINTLALSIVERTRELGMLRAVGLFRFQVVRMITVESVVIAVFGALLGTVVGGGLGAAVVSSLADRGIPVLSIPWLSIAAFLGLAVVVGLLAAVLPAIRAARVDVLRAIAYE